MTVQAIVFMVATAVLLFGVVLLFLRAGDVHHGEQKAAPPPAEPLRDPGAEVLEHLRKLEARAAPGLAAHVLPIFLQDSTVRLAALREAVAREDGDTVHRIAHTLHGSAATVGAASFVAGCMQIIREVRSGSFDRCEPVINQLEHDLESIRESAALRQGRD
jgi:HPt (histidine-containing phosphotransfer) domain-containing protein